jgi:pimeloyl-ACP methyl ester carboxylesterase
MISYPFQVAGVMTRVLEAGAAGTPVVLIHGVGARADRWRRNVDALAAGGYHVYALDLPGHGFATKGAGFDYSIAGYTDFIAAFVKERGLERPVLIGTSLGGHIAASLACRQPERIRALVLVGSLGLVPVGPDVRARLRTGIPNTTRQGITDKLRRVLYDPALVTEEWIEEEFQINNSFGAADGFERLGRYFGERIDDDVIGPALARVGPALPTLLVWGAEERAVPLEVGKAAHAALPGSRFVVIPSTSHAPYFEKPDEFNRIVLDFLPKS